MKGGSGRQKTKSQRGTLESGQGHTLEYSVPSSPPRKERFVSKYEYVVLHAVRERTNITHTLN